MDTTPGFYIEKIGTTLDRVRASPSCLRAWCTRTLADAKCTPTGPCGGRPCSITDQCQMMPGQAICIRHLFAIQKAVKLTSLQYGPTISALSMAPRINRISYAVEHWWKDIMLSPYTTLYCARMLGCSEKKAILDHRFCGRPADSSPLPLDRALTILLILL